MPWQVIQYVTSGFTLCAFIVAVVASVLKRQADNELKGIQSAPEAERGRLVEAKLEFFHVDTSGLTKEQQFMLAVQQINERAARFRTIAIVVIVLAVIGASLSAYAISQPVSKADVAPPNMAWCENLDGVWEMKDTQNVNSGLFTMTLSHHDDDGKRELAASRSDGSTSKYVRGRTINHWIGTVYYPSTRETKPTELSAESNCTRLVFANPRFYFVRSGAD